MSLRVKRALISVYDKTGILELAQFLHSQNVEIISTGGTYRYLTENNIPALEVSQLTQSKEILDGRVKTLHPAVFGGILARRDDENHMATMQELNLGLIDMVVVNLYPFFEKMHQGLNQAEMIEFIDIGGPSMLRASAKSFKDVIVLTNQKDYAPIIEKLLSDFDVDQKTRQQLAAKVFNLTSSYDAAIANYLGDEDFPQYLTNVYEKSLAMRYGENAHQAAHYYVNKAQPGAMSNFEQLNGKALSFNNIRDMDLAWKVVGEFEESACCAVKHSTPCGVAIGKDLSQAFDKAYEADPVSIFGGILAFNKTLDVETVQRFSKIFLEIVIAPDFSEDALALLKQKANLRVIRCTQKATDKMEMIQVDGGLLCQERDNQLLTELTQVTKAAVSDEQKADLLFALKVVKWVKSNAIVVVKNGQTLGIGGGEVSRIWAAEKALERAKKFAQKDLILASDAFFPFDDTVRCAAENDVVAIVQPGGSMRDEDSIRACDELGLAMYFSYLRHFKH